MKYFIPILLAFFVFNAYSQDRDKVVAYGKLKVEWGNLDNTEIVVYEDGKAFDSFKPAVNGGKFDFELELNHKYQFYFSKRNYVTKIVDFDTHVPDRVLNSPDFEPFPDFDFYVTLFETYPEVDTMFFRNSVGKIQYNPKDYDFDWDKNYTLEIQRRLEQIESNIRNKRKQAEFDKEQRERQTEEKRIADEEAMRKAKKQAKLDAERLKEKEKAEKEASKLAAEQAKKEQEQAERKARDKELAERDAQRTAEIQVKEEKERLANEQAKQKIRDNAAEKKQLELAAAKKKENKENKTKIAQAKKESLAQVVPEPVVKKINETSLQRTKPFIISKPKTIRTDVSKQNLAGKKVTRIEVNHGDITSVFLKVEYSWGGCYFFIQDEIDEFRNISQSYFNIMTNKK